MSRLSTEAGLSRKYTNHCIRARITSSLHEQGFSSRAIISVTGHRNVTSLASYIKPSEDERERLSKALCPRSDSQGHSVEQVHSQNTQISKVTIPSPPCQNQVTQCQSVSPDQYSSVSASYSYNSFDVNLHASGAVNMFTGNISGSAITVYFK